MVSLSKKSAWFLGTLAALLVTALVWVMVTPGLRPVLIDADKPPTLRVAKPEKNLGRIPMEVPAKTVYDLTNIGGAPLKLLKVDPSCGCTAAKLGKTVLSPGDSTQLKVELDTSLKVGPTLKTIVLFTNDPKHPETTLTLKADVIPSKESVHNGMVKVKDRLALFKGKCQSCHVAKGVGKLGADLFVADCGMCHGMKAEGGVSPSLLKGDYASATYREYVKKMITEGSPSVPTMAPFGKAHGGPLSEAQVDSLVVYLSYLWEQKQSAQKETSASAP
jgi:mono/diheme cytochrome c family protein